MKKQLALITLAVSGFIFWTAQMQAMHVQTPKQIKNLRYAMLQQDVSKLCNSSFSDTFNNEELCAVIVELSKNIALYRDSDGNTILHLAVKQQNIRLIKAILLNSTLGEPDRQKSPGILRKSTENQGIAADARLPLTWIYNDYGQKAWDEAKSSGNTWIINLFKDLVFAK